MLAKLQAGSVKIGALWRPWPMRYRHTPDMTPLDPDPAADQLMQDMLEHGVNWLKSHPEADIRFERYQDVVGLFYSNTTDAQELLSEVIHTSHNEATGGQIHNVIERLG